MQKAKFYKIPYMNTYSFCKLRDSVIHENFFYRKLKVEMMILIIANNINIVLIPATAINLQEISQLREIRKGSLHY